MHSTITAPVKHPESKNIPEYHYLIKRDGSIVRLLDEKKRSVKESAQNPHCIHIAYIGGADKNGKPADNRSDAQKHAMFDKIVALTEKYPKAEVVGHRDIAEGKEECPCFDVKQWLREYEPDLNNVA